MLVTAFCTGLSYVSNVIIFSVDRYVQKMYNIIICPCFITRYMNNTDFFLCESDLIVEKLYF